MNEQRIEQLITWLESMPWWVDLSYAKLKRENKRYSAALYDALTRKHDGPSDELFTDLEVDHLMGVALLVDTEESMSLSEVKEKYLPNRDLNELRGVTETQEPE